MPANLIMLDSDPPLTRHISGKDAKGNPAPLATDAGHIANWNSSNPAVLAVAPSADGLSATYTPGTPGTSQVTVHAFSTQNDPVTGTETVEMDAGEATSLTFSS